MDEAVKERELFAYAGDDRVISSVEYWELIKNRKPLPRHNTGIMELDEAIGGFEPGELIVISGPTAMGKTTLCDTIIRNMSTEGKRALFFTFEVTPEKIVEAHRTQGDSIYLPLQHKSMDLAWLRDRCHEAKLKYPETMSAVFIDHLHYVVDMASNKNISLEIGSTMRYLKRVIALDLRLPVFIVCHSAKIPFDQEPSINHLRDSSFVAQEADTVLVVFRRFDKEFGKTLETLSQGLATIKVEKARRVGTMGRKINVCKQENKLVQSDY